jgi:hypothetical protein
MNVQAAARDAHAAAQAQHPAATPPGCRHGGGRGVEVSGPMRAIWRGVWALGLLVCADLGDAAAPTATPAATASAAKARSPAPTQPTLIDINSASRELLKTLPGIGDVEADRIISGRPYHSKADLAERNVIPTGVYLSLKGSIIAKQKAKGKVGVP